MRYYKFLSAVCAAALLLTACGNASMSDQPGDGKWRDSGIAGSVTESEEIRLQDDFAAAANKDFIVSASPGDSTIMSTVFNVIEKKEKLVGELPDDGEAGELKKFVALASDWDVRNREGAEPLRKYLEAIEAISSLEDLTRYQCDPEINPLGLGVLMPLMSTKTAADPTVCAVLIDTPELSLKSDLEYESLTSAGLEAREMTNRMTEHILGKLGYNAGSIKKLLKANYRFEKKMALAVYPLPESDQKKEMRDWEETVAAAKGYPLGEILTAWNVPKEGTFYMNKE